MTDPTPTRAEVERDLLMAVLLGAEYRVDLDWLHKHGMEGATALGKRAAELTIAMRDERDALRERAEAAEGELIMAYAQNDAHIRTINSERAEAREQAALAWVAGRDAAAKAGGIWLGFNSQGDPTGEYCTVEAHDPGDMSLWVSQNRIRALTPPADLSAALTARLAAEWDAAIEAAEAAYAQGFAAIRALRRAAPTEGEA